MPTRTAIDQGTLGAGREEEVFRRSRDGREPPWRRFSRIEAVRVQRATAADGDCPPIAATPGMDCEDMEAIEDRMASKVRPASHEATESAMPLSDGRFHPLVAVATALDPAG